MEKAAVSCLLSTAGIFLQNSRLSAPILCSLSNLLSCDLVFGRGDLFPSPEPVLFSEPAFSLLRKSVDGASALTPDGAVPAGGGGTGGLSQL